MTLFMVDCSRHQVERAMPLSLAEALKAGFGIVNIQLDRGRQEDVLPSWALGYAVAARSFGMGISTYKWLDSRTSGAEAARRAYDRMVALGGPDGMAHIVDCESDATEQQLRDYVTFMQGLLGRPIGIYSGRWWLQPKGWQLADLTPYLHAAPNGGYQTNYPGDDSGIWQAGYGGWATLSVCQYGVLPLPGTGDCSLSAIRDPAVWAALTTGGADVSALQDWQNAGQPVSGVARPVKRIGDRLRAYGYTVYYIGNAAHLAHVPPEDHTPFSATGWPIPSPRWWIFADDIMPPPPGSGLPTLQQLGAQMLTDAMASHTGMKWLKFQNWEPERDNGGACYQERFMPNYERRPSTDRGHIHQSCRSDMKDYAGADDYDPVARVRGQQSDKMEDDMQPVLVKLDGDAQVKLVTMGIGHIPVADDADLKRWQKFMSDNQMATTVFAWPAASRPQCGPDLTAVPTLTVTPEVATAIAQEIVATGSNDLSEADLAAIEELVVEGAKKAAREGTGE